MECEAIWAVPRTLGIAMLSCCFTLSLAGSRRYRDGLGILKLLSEVTEPCWTYACCSVASAFAVSI